MRETSEQKSGSNCEPRERRLLYLQDNHPWQVWSLQPDHQLDDCAWITGYPEIEHQLTKTKRALHQHEPLALETHTLEIGRCHRS